MSLQLKGDAARITLQWPPGVLAEPLRAEMGELLEQAGQRTTVSLQHEIPFAPTPPLADSLAGAQPVRNLLIVSSAKGGVGKSTLAVNLALSLSQAGAAVGLLDADIYGPNVPRLLGLASNQRPKTSQVGERQVFEPIRSAGLSVLSMAMLTAVDSAMIWRGPMVSGALKQLLLQTLWGELDYLIVDMPPGTGDIPLTLAQSVPVSGALLVSTPDPMARDDTARGCAMLRKLKLPLLGLVENMAWWECSQCAHRHEVFARRQADDPTDDALQGDGLELLDSLPLMAPTADGRAHLLAGNTAAAGLWQGMASKVALALVKCGEQIEISRPRILKMSHE